MQRGGTRVNQQLAGVLARALPFMDSHDLFLSAQDVLIVEPRPGLLVSSQFAVPCGSHKRQVGAWARWEGGWVGEWARSRRMQQECNKNATLCMNLSPLLDVRAHDVDVIVVGPRVGPVMRQQNRWGTGATHAGMVKEATLQALHTISGTPYILLPALLGHFDSQQTAPTALDGNNEGYRGTTCS